MNYRSPLPSDYIVLCWLAGCTVEEALYALRDTYSNYRTSRLVKYYHVEDIYSDMERGFEINRHKLDWELSK